MFLKKFVALPKEKGKTPMNQWENDDSDIIRAIYSGYLNKLGVPFPYLFVC